MVMTANNTTGKRRKDGKTERRKERKNHTKRRKKEIKEKT
jgi:hypothetical protein